MKLSIGFLGVLLLCGCMASFAADEEYKPGPSQYGMTKWAKDVSPDNALPEYPRPMMVRKDWLNLNGLWQYAVTAKETQLSGVKFSATDQILVPFPIEAPLSGVGKQITQFKERTYINSRLWYKHSFKVPSKWKGQRVLLHFGAVDWEAVVTLNGKELGTHKGGYDSFSFDITDTMKEGDNELIVAVWDPTRRGGFPRGKQKEKAWGAFWYTPCSGIWQTVWLEPVAKTSIDSFKIVPDIDKGIASLTVASRNGAKAKVRVTVFDGKKKVATAVGKTGEVLELKIPKAKLWWPDDPFLYDMKIELLTGLRSKVVDSVDSYFGMRKTSIAKDEKGIMRMMLNNKFIVQNGVLDQGYWPDGNYVAPTDEALRYDIEMIKKFGYNMSRKHIKVEPQRWYYWCDKLGLLVWQDMVSTGDAPEHSKPEFITDDPTRNKQHQAEMVEMINEKFNHPCIVMWVLYNEGMGLAGKKFGYKLFDETKDFMRETYAIADKLDPDRLIDHESGSPGGGYQGHNAMDLGIGDVADAHCYGTTKCIKPSDTRASVIGEYCNKIEPYAPLVTDPGISGLVYTQITDVEKEGKGLMSYDRSKFHFDPAKRSAAIKKALGQYLKH